jgi:hypothetical protein
VDQFPTVPAGTSLTAKPGVAPSAAATTWNPAWRRACRTGARRGALAGVAFTDPDHLTRILRRGLGQIQHRLVDGCLTESSLTINPTPDTNPKTSQ